jgi:UDP-3-O-acyl-N-acetylglucosamine deacetylase
MYLLPFDWPCRVTAYRTGHALNHQLAALLLKEVDAGRVKLL